MEGKRLKNKFAFSVTQPKGAEYDQCIDLEVDEMICERAGFLAKSFP